jgi:hypothetical protein
LEPLISRCAVEIRRREEKVAAAGGKEERGGAAMLDGGGLAGVAQSGATVHSFQILWHGSEGETEANSAGHISRAKDVSRRVAMAGSGRGLTGVAS